MFNFSLMFILLMVVCAFNSQVQENKNQLPNSNLATENQTLETIETKDKKNIKDILGKDLVTAISKAKEVNIYHLNSFVTTPTQSQSGKQHFADYEVLGFGKLNKKQAKELKKTLLNAKNYFEPDFVNKCTFVAITGWEFKLKNKSIKVVLSYPCKKLLFLENGQESFRDVNSVKQFDQIAQTFFKNLPKVQ